MSVRITAGIAAAALALVGCSQTSPDRAPAPGDQAPASQHGSLSECLQANGVTDAGGPAAVLGPPQGVDPDTWEQAMRSCSSLAPGPAAP